MAPIPGGRVFDLAASGIYTAESYGVKGDMVRFLGRWKSPDQKGAQHLIPAWLHATITGAGEMDLRQTLSAGWEKFEIEPICPPEGPAR